MLQIQSKLTSQGQVSVPAAVRQFLSLTPGSVLVWTEEEGRITVERAVRHSTAEVHQALFAGSAPVVPAHHVISVVAKEPLIPALLPAGRDTAIAMAALVYGRITGKIEAFGRSANATSRQRRSHQRAGQHARDHFCH